MGFPRARPFIARLCLLLLATSATGFSGSTVGQAVSSSSGTSLDQFIGLLRGKAKALEGSNGMRVSFRAFTSTHELPAESVRYSDYVVARLLFEATRDAGLWNLHWSITDQPPNSDSIWRQWRNSAEPTYGGASDATLQQLRYLREGVFLKFWSREQAAHEALRKRSDLGSGPVEDLAAFQDFALDMRAASSH